MLKCKIYSVSIFIQYPRVPILLNVKFELLINDKIVRTKGSLMLNTTVLKFILLTNLKLPTTVGILIFIFLF